MQNPETHKYDTSHSTTFTGSEHTLVNSPRTGSECRILVSYTSLLTIWPYGIFMYLYLMIAIWCIFIGLKPFVCNTCQHGFSSELALIEHTYLHTNTKPHTCDVCKKAFRQVSVISVWFILLMFKDLHMWRNVAIFKKGSLTVLDEYSTLPIIIFTVAFLFLWLMKQKRCSTSSVRKRRNPAVSVVLCYSVATLFSC